MSRLPPATIDQPSAVHPGLEKHLDGAPLLADSGFAARLVAWQRQHGRHDLPWQQRRDPYPIWLAEIMLQQTQVRSVLPYFSRFMVRFPDVHALAAAPLAEVLALWAGLGYYARARNLHATARQVVAEYAGLFPDNATALARLPGIGRSTAAAIAAFAYGARAAILDGNVKRVLCRHFGIDDPPGSSLDKRLWPLAEALLPDSAAMPAYTQGLMDLGALVCVRRAPRCTACPLADSCRARRQGRTAEWPTPRALRQRPRRPTPLFIVSDGQSVLLERRPPQGLWGGLLALPESLAALTPLALALDPPQALPARQHLLTHLCLDIQPFLLRPAAPPRLAETDLFVWLPLAEALAAGVPAPVARLLRELDRA